MAVIIRPANAADLAAITAIYARSVRQETASFEETPPVESEMMRRWQAIVDAGYPYLVAEDEGHVAGYCYASQYRSRPAYRYTVEDSIYLDPAYFGRGIARRLLADLVDACTAGGYRQMLAIIGDAAFRDQSIRLHESCGFTFVGKLDAVGYKHDIWCDTVFLQRALGAGRTSPP